MTVFVDTSGLYAVIDFDDSRHRAADQIWTELLTSHTPLRTHSYVLVELSALVQARLGMEAARLLHDDVMPLISVRFVDLELHRQSVTALLAAGNRSLSLVDWTSFELMRDEGLTQAFAFDDDFSRQGFNTLSATSSEP